MAAAARQNTARNSGVLASNKLQSLLVPVDLTPGSDREPVRFRTDAYAAYYRSVKRSLEESLQGNNDTYPDPSEHCDACRWRSHCDSRRRQDDHLCLVAGITKIQTAELARHNDDLVRRALAEMHQGTLVDRVRGAIAAELSRDPSPSKVARALGVSERSLQRHLAKHGTTFADLLNDTRREVACAYLREPRWSITEVAFLLGFEDASSFARAFRRWTGNSPTEFRAAGGRSIRT